MGQHRLARAGLAGQDVEARGKSQLGAFEQQQVLDAQLVQHGPGLPGAPDGSECRRAAQGRVASRPNFWRRRLVEVRARKLRERPLAVGRTGLDLRPGRELQDRAAVDGTSTGSSRERLWIASRSPGATTSGRAVSECGAMNETTNPSTPHAMTGPPLARL